MADRRRPDGPRTMSNDVFAAERAVRHATAHQLLLRFFLIEEREHLELARRAPARARR